MSLYSILSPPIKYYKNRLGISVYDSQSYMENVKLIKPYMEVQLEYLNKDNDVKQNLTSIKIFFDDYTCGIKRYIGRIPYEKQNYISFLLNSDRNLKFIVSNIMKDFRTISTLEISPVDNNGDFIQFK